MNNILFFSTWFEGHPVKRHVLKVLAKQYQVTKASFPRSWFETRDLLAKIRKTDLVVIWNGDEPGCEWLRQTARLNSKPVLIAEQGLLPQTGQWHLDSSGITGHSSLCGELDWVTPEMVGSYESYRESYFKSKGYRYQGGGGYMLCPLQVEHDTAIYLHSQFRTMEEFLQEVVRLNPGKRIIATPHPSRQGNIPIHVDGVKVVKDKTTMELAQYADSFSIITSTVGYEMAALVDGNAPINVFGRCPLASHGLDIKKLLAACHARQIPMSVEDVRPWVDRLIGGNLSSSVVPQITTPHRPESKIPSIFRDGLGALSRLRPGHRNQVHPHEPP